MHVKSKSGFCRAASVLMVCVVLAVCGLIVAACAEETTTTAAPTETTAAQTETTAAQTETTAETSTGATLVENTNITKMGIIIPEESNDYSWNQIGREAAEELAAKLGVPIEVHDGAGYGDVSAIANQLADKDVDFLIAFASGYDPVQKVAENRNVPTVMIGMFEAGNVPGITQDIETRAEDGGYMVGVLAALTTKVDCVAAVTAAEDENYVRMSGAFVAGVRSVDPNIKILYAQVGQAAYGDAAGAKRTVDTLIAGGADVVFGLGNAATWGMLQSCETATPPAGAEKVWFIDVEGDKTAMPEHTDTILSTMFWDYSPAFEAAANALNNGTFGTEVFFIDLENGGISVLKTRHISDEVWTQMEAARADVIAGKVDVPDATSSEDVRAIIAEK